MLLSHPPYPVRLPYPPARLSDCLTPNLICRPSLYVRWPETGTGRAWGSLTTSITGSEDSSVFLGGRERGGREGETEARSEGQNVRREKTNKENQPESTATLNT